MHSEMNESNEVKISIVIPVWNGETFLETAIKSAINQTHRNLEIILVDDCSTDGSFSIIEKFKLLDSRIKVIQNNENMKLPASLNAGFSIATGAWHTWTSDDNIMDTDFIEKLLTFAVTQNLEFVYSNYRLIDEQSNFIQTSFVESPLNLYQGNCIGASFLYKSEIYSKLGGYDQSKFMYEDYDFWVRALKSGVQMGMCASAPYAYRIHPGQLSITRKLPKDFLRYRWNVASELGPDNPQSIARTRISILGAALRNRYLLLGGALLLRSMIFHPWATSKGFSDWLRRTKP